MTVVIPVYNEEDCLTECLDAVVAQTRPIDEVIVVDNNSTDGTRAIADTYADRLPLVVLNESQQGLMYSRTTGLDAAKGDVLARFDADTRLSEEWCERVMAYMEENPELDAMTGPTLFYDNPGLKLQKRKLREAMPKLLETPPEKKTWPISGNHMILRKSAWESVKPLLLNDPKLHEDVDISCAAAKVGLTMWYCHTVYVWVSARRYRSPFKELKRYIQTTYDTIEAHGLTQKAEWYKGQMPGVTRNFRVMWLIQNNYNADTGRFVPFFLKRDKKTRVLPV